MGRHTDRTDGWVDILTGRMDGVDILTGQMDSEIY